MTTEQLLQVIVLRGMRTRVWVLCEAKTLGSSRFAIVDKAEVEDLAGAAEDVGDLLL
jgi:hypothetical protein